MCKSNSLLQGRVVQVGQEVQGFQGCRAHHLFLEVQDFPREKNPTQLLFLSGKIGATTGELCI